MKKVMMMMAMLAVSFAVGLLLLKLTREAGWTNTLIAAGFGALTGAFTELFSPSEYDTVTVPVMILTALLILESI